MRTPYREPRRSGGLSGAYNESPDPDVTTSAQVGVSLMLEDDFLVATLPLFENGEVDVLEWSFDVGWGRDLPAWAQGLLQHFSVSRRLLGHGVSFSPLSACRNEPQRDWLHRAGLEVARLRYRHVSEHYGFMAAGDFSRGSPMPLPAEPSVLRTGRDALSRLADATGLAVGLENLALALSDRDVDAQGDMLDGLLEPVGGFLVLDLHNLFCQAINFGREPMELVERYPLDRVRELHVSGGSWSQPQTPSPPFRRDTHDDRIPDEVHAMLPDVLAACPRIEAVIVERLGGTFGSALDGDIFRDDYQRVRRSVQACARAVAPPAPARPSLLSHPVATSAEVESLARFQAAMLDSLDRGITLAELRAELHAVAPGATTRDWLDAVEARTAEVAGELVRKWGRRQATHVG